MRERWRITLAGYEIVLRQRGQRFEVAYGESVTTNLIYSEAGTVLGHAIMHALTCEGKLDA